MHDEKQMRALRARYEDLSGATELKPLPNWGNHLKVVQPRCLRLPRITPSSSTRRISRSTHVGPPP